MKRSERENQILVGAREARLDDEDDCFDRLYPGRCRELSAIHWTPVRVARRVAQLLDLRAEDRLLDIGSGVGKFCLVASSCSPATFVGVERRRALVDLALDAQCATSTSRVEFVHGDAFRADWQPFQALYFYNPFGDRFLEDWEKLDDQPHEGDDFDRAVLLAEDRLSRMGGGTKVALYHGFGGGMPPGYDLVRSELCGTDVIEIWLKR